MQVDRAAHVHFPVQRVLADKGHGSLIRPKLGVSGVWNFDISDNPASQGYPLGDNALRARFDAGLDVTTPAAEPWRWKAFMTASASATTPHGAARPASSSR